MTYETETTKTMTNRELAEAIVDDRIARGQFGDDDRDWLVEREMRETRESLVNGFNAIEHWNEADDNENDDADADTNEDDIDTDTDNHEGNIDSDEYESYIKMTKRHQEEWNAKVRELSPMVFYAIGDYQFEKALSEYLKAGGNRENLVILCGGLYGDEDCISCLAELAYKNSDELYHALMSNHHFSHNAIMYEMANHEYGWSEDDEAVLEALGIRDEDFTGDFKIWYEEAREDYMDSVADYIW